MKRLSIQFATGLYQFVNVTEIDDCEVLCVYKAEGIGGVAYFEANCDLSVTELGELAVAALYSELVTNVTEV